MGKESQHLFIDFEFTMPEQKGRPKGFFPEIIEVGIVVARNYKVIDTFSSYVRPQHFPTLTNRCKTFLSIEQQSVDSGITLQELADLFKNYCKNYETTVVTWGNMDMKVLRQNCQKARIPFTFKGEQVDLSMEYKKFFGDRNQTGLWKAVEAYGKKGTGTHHRALDDAMTTYNIFKLVEKDKSYLSSPAKTTIGDRIDLSKVLNKFA
ncbi:MULTISPECIES: 3'-5' exonuclease KapD [Priestia]|jgi:sporulation inhibitor KapD|uniref:Or 3'-5' exonuclease KapD n=3 Tax=Priestia TaxID=2800373 RepID=A0A0H4KLU3_9BACI|nr:MULTISPECIES: 3'-5' exonuclease KapD [Priestia]AKO94555.1 or 3'-5' exonuclease KapD [Priestia filamentosa]KAB2492238.1 3'-5' exonuclease KapD [Priestia endophytica]KYG28324.1 sporulation inhibitor KapD [Priestia endophytica]MBG9810538.1 sporulation inhibitor KapD [Priestia endophytica]MCM3540062.1 3'-5' exonuclease KapD [Priestia endophytica]